MNALDKLRKALSEACEAGEFLMGLVVVAGILIAIIGLGADFAMFWQNRDVPGSFMDFLEPVSLVVIGIEFAKMLCRPSTANIIEVLIFLIARQMIIEHQAPDDMLLSVIAICLLFLFRRIMLATKPDRLHHHVPNIIKALKIAQSEEFIEAMETLESESEKEEAGEQKPENEEKTNMDDFWAD